MAAVGVGDVSRLAVGSMEEVHAEVEVAEGVRPTRGVAQVVSLVAPRRNRPGRAEPAAASRRRPLAEARQEVEVERAPVPQQRQRDHGLAEPVLLVDVLDRVHLVDHVDEVPGLGDTPEDATGAEGQLPVATHSEPVGLADVEVGPLVVLGVHAQVGREDDAVLPFRAREAPLRREREAELDTPAIRAKLAGMGRALPEAPATPFGGIVATFMESFVDPTFLDDIPTLYWMPFQSRQVPLPRMTEIPSRSSVSVDMFSPLFGRCLQSPWTRAVLWYLSVLGGGENVGRPGRSWCRHVAGFLVSRACASRSHC